MKRPPILPLLLALAPLFAAGAGDPATNVSAAGTDDLAILGAGAEATVLDADGRAAAGKDLAGSVPIRHSEAPRARPRGI